ncbi:GL15689 [Drosophila persimilis]|uniref:GL15689 n=1 Tax=Drosophila persimilis TaxID=7234 RepID=B4H8Z4_DROPE|nr:GL15689 [Drosophila persimilis]
MSEYPFRPIVLSGHLKLQLQLHPKSSIEDRSRGSAAPEPSESGQMKPPSVLGLYGLDFVSEIEAIKKTDGRDRQGHIDSTDADQDNTIDFMRSETLPSGCYTQPHPSQNE